MLLPYSNNMATWSKGEIELFMLPHQSIHDYSAKYKDGQSVKRTEPHCFLKGREIGPE